MSDHTPEPFIPAQPVSYANALGETLDALPSDAHRPEQTQFTRVRQAAFLKRLADTGEVRVAAKASSISHQTAYRMRRACPDFARGWDAALIVARERAEDLLATRAMHGVEEQVFYHGEVVATRRRYDSRLLLAHLARLDRLAEREAVAAGLAQAFDDVIAAFEMAGEGEDVALPEARAEKPSGPCNMRSKSLAKSLTMSPGSAELDEDAERANELERRLLAMEAARPEYAPRPDQLAHSIEETDELEWAQLLAFEDGEARWWEVRVEAQSQPPIWEAPGIGHCQAAHAV